MASYESTVTGTTTVTLGAGKKAITERLDEYILKVLPQDLLTTLRGVAMQELDAQITSGNLPSQILVDNRSVARRGIVDATRSVSMRFADVSTLMTGIRAAYDTLLRITRVQSPPKNAVIARKHFWLYLNGAAVGLMPGALNRLEASRLDTKSVLRIVGPLVPYGRKLFWTPIGRSKSMSIVASISPAGRETMHYETKYSPRFKPLRMRTLRRAANAAGGDPAANLSTMLRGRPGTVENAGQIAKRILRKDRRLAALYISDGWVTYPPAGSWGANSKNARVPSISVQMARRGGVQVLKSSL
jgi:hypothetical protein